MVARVVVGSGFATAVRWMFALTLAVLVLGHLDACHAADADSIHNATTCTHGPADAEMCSVDAVAAAASPQTVRRPVWDRVSDLWLAALLLAAVPQVARMIRREGTRHRSERSGRDRLHILQIARC